ncbi:blast:Serine proteinase stubble [Drosophila guanche]|uniref:Blast:Serine proteinase stubble n=1 Tax=Drosophila guanche TaxID=7266 RepID=A0A3B0JMR3_DROGU|nr:blast:Serine proteinase stubble [Drosophila guanche]
MGAQYTSTDTDTDTDTYASRTTRSSTDLAPKSRTTTKHKMPLPSLVPSLLLLLTLASLSLLLPTTHASPVFVDNPSLAQFQSGRNIRHLPCIVRKSGRSGVCMFAIDCIKQNGTHLGTCIDRFYFGSCCAMKEEASLFAPELNDNSIDQNTISHFAHESTTLPTSSLFKLTTESGFSSSSSGGGTTHKSSQQHTSNELLKNVTQSYLSTAKPVRTTLSTTTSSRRPALDHTTHKNSHFVVRTTAKPSGLPSTTIRPLPPRRRTTSARPVLTTAAVVLEQRIETTTVPAKFVTFQIVETTTPPVTEPTHLVETTTTATRRHTRPSTSSSVSGSSSTSVKTTTTTTTKAPGTTAKTTTQRPTPPLRTTTTASTTKPHKTHSSRRPTPTKKPIGSTITTAASGTQSTRKPVDNLSSSSSTTANATTVTTSPVRRPVIQTSSSVTSTTTTTSTSFNNNNNNNNNNNRTTSTKLPERTTQAPRPRPKPTAEFVKVPIMLAEEPASQTATTTTTSSSSSTSSSTSTASKSPATTSTTSSGTTTTTTTTTRTTTPKPTRRHTTKVPTTTPNTTKATTTTTTTTTAKPTTRTTTTTTTTTTSTSRPATEPALSSSTTSNKIESETLSTKKPGLITWTDVEAEPQTNASISNDWQPVPAASASTDLSPTPTPQPEASNKTSTSTDFPAPPTATDKVVISVATSVSTSESKPGSGGSHMPTEKPHRTTKPPKATTTARPVSTTTIKTTEAPESSTESSSSSSSVAFASSTSSSTELSSEMATSSGSTTAETATTEGATAATTDYSGEEVNLTTTVEPAAESTSLAPTNALEGVDYKEVCGRRMFPEPRIVGGANAAFGRWPWQISLRQWRTSTYLHKCGAALLNENWAITAAHCVDNVPPSDLLLRLGEYDLAEEEEPYGYQERRVQIVASHPQFDPRTFEYDLALLRFYEPVVFQPNIIPVCVPDNDENFIGQTAFVTGWGRLYEDGPLPSVLQEVAVPVINNTICESMYRTAGYIEHIPHIFICAGWKKGGYDSCEGDSGGPMVLQREADKRFQLGGVISWGIGCAEANQPGVYTRISEFRDWINQILQF